MMGRKDEVGDKQYCCDEHWRADEAERIMGPTGVFRPMIEEYMRTTAANYYSASTLHTVRASLAKFFRYVAQIETISILENVRPPVVSRFIVMEHQRGMTTRSAVGYLATFFNNMIAEERYSRVNPVIPRIHSQRGAPAAERAYVDRDLNAIWACVEETGKLELLLAFAIGEECGLRIGEVCNIRLSDVDTSAQTIFVRLPTKNKRTRTVPFHAKVIKYLDLWLAQRDALCPTDHLLHNTAAHCFTGIHIDSWFKSRLCKLTEPAASFKFHRLRHTWATRLMNNGMDLATLKELGGWESWNSMQRYIKVLDTTVRSQYEAAYARLEQKAESDQDEAISMVDFAHMDAEVPAIIDTPIA
jgi:site-specific recombinase XerD